MVNSNCLLRGPAISWCIPNRWRTTGVTLQRCHSFQNSSAFWPGWARSFLHTNILKRLWLTHGSCREGQYVHSSQSTMVWTKDFFRDHVPRSFKWGDFFNKHQYQSKWCTMSERGLIHLSGEDRSNQAFMILNENNDSASVLLGQNTGPSSFWGQSTESRNHFHEILFLDFLAEVWNLCLPLSVSYQFPSSRRTGAGPWNTTIDGVNLVLISKSHQSRVQKGKAKDALCALWGYSQSHVRCTTGKKREDGRG